MIKSHKTKLTMIIIDKQIGETPLEAIQKYKQKHPELEDKKIAYAGRLDPMAHGLLLVLIGKECKIRDHYQGLDKTYRFKVLFGIKTDSYDMLGLVSNVQGIDILKTQKVSPKLLTEFTGQITQEYPPYSSKTVNGKPLYWWARRGKLHEIEIPKKDVTIKSLKLKNSVDITGKKLLQYISENINNVSGDFRQAKILKRWDKVLALHSTTKFLIIEFEADVTSGTYIRSLAYQMGEFLGLDAMTLEIERTRIGEFSSVS